jgi:uncharacterized protein YndB with AHSA1/START domain
MSRTYRYVERAEVEIAAPIGRVYAVSTDPTLVPRYAHEVASIDVLERPDERTAIVCSHLHLGPARVGFRYRYRYRPPTHYIGVQLGRGLVRGYFTFAFEARGGATLVSHAEGVISKVPGLALMVGLVYFRALGGGGLRGELERLKALVESGVALADESHADTRA